MRYPLMMLVLARVTSLALGATGDFLSLGPASLTAAADDPAPAGEDDAWLRLRPAGEQPPQTDQGWVQRSWEMPPVVVQGQPGGLAEEERIGTYAQPRWTARRRFPSTRVYVIPEGHVEVEAWARATVSRHDGTEWRFLQEVEVGLPYRFQLDLYARQDYATEDDETLWGGQFEVRWALADWGQIWGNPTLYFEYLVLEDRPDKVEPKLLLGGEISEGWHWAANLITELELSGEREYEYSASGAVSRTIIDEKLSLGAEAVFAATDVADDRGHYGTSFVIGPSLQWSPVHNFTVNFAPLVGIGGESPLAQIYLNVGWEF